MCCDDLVCAACSGRVAEGNCPTCRAYRAVRHGAGADRSAMLVPVLLALAAVLLVLALHAQLG